MIGVTAGTHRLWSHRSYKAKWPMRLILMIFQTIAFQDTIYQWARDHRVHHKFTDTDADPYNARRGFFFSHIGWLLIRKHPDIVIKGATIDCSDLMQDPLVMFQKKWYRYLMPLCAFIIPMLVPWWAWNENLWYSWHLTICRYCITLNITWLVNSVAHKWGMKPYDKSLSSTENIGVSLLTCGEGWHNYHHAFPWDYKMAEIGNYKFNLAKTFIDFFAYIGLAYDLKTVSVDVIKKRVLRCVESSTSKMTPNILSTDSEILTEKDLQNAESSITKMIDTENYTQNRSKDYAKTEGWFKTEPKWFNILYLGFLHLYFVYACFTFDFFENLMTTAWLFIVYGLGGIGTTAGPHRLWTHQAYKAKWQLRVILGILYASAGMNNIYEWVRDHRIHHKYTDTDADPHNSNRGFFFSHVGWLMVKKNPDVIRRGHQVDMSDVLADPVAAFNIKYFPILKFMFAFLLPVMLPVYAWKETWYRAFVSQNIIRYVFLLNAIWSVNSAAHIWGSKPYDAYINPTENRWVNLFTGGEGLHNYHHVFPWDYKAAELHGSLTTAFINFFAKIGWAYDLKEPSKELVKTVTRKRGDGNHPLWEAVPYPVISKIE
ncbi:PREDICTED: acyl-CoA Delta(11) desaturase-like isoform X1 [Atta colombica]|uniref:acyl-CoA Delta(11) desaturase-like isoform X1 n=1 Tax=Atta colombica TaxID=520822 RepID=UPI00084CD2B2|nr:PREDICTED: acyl-CoA Delta(11) desaturase-like isoform X1 [Atta colombica]